MMKGETKLVSFQILSQYRLSALSDEKQAELLHDFRSDPNVSLEAMLDSVDVAVWSFPPHLLTNRRARDVTNWLHCK